MKVAVPCNDEIAVGVQRNRRSLLTSRRVRVHAKLAALPISGCVKTLRVDTRIVTVLPGALPRHDEIAIGVQRNVGEGLVPRRVRVNAEFVALRDC